MTTRIVLRLIACLTISPCFAQESKESQASLVAILQVEDRAIENLVLIWDARRNQRHVIPEDLKTATGDVAFVHRDGQIIPHVAFAQTGKTLVFQNESSSGHSTNISFFNHASPSLLVPKSRGTRFQLTKDEPAPIPVECNIHPSERAYLIVQSHPYVGISDSKGHLRIEHLPIGKNWFRIWHEDMHRSIHEIQINDRLLTTDRSRIEIDLAPGENNLGTIRIASNQFKTTGRRVVE